MWTWSTFNSCFPQNVYKRGALSAAELQARGVWVSFVTTGICGPSSHPIVTACQRAICALVLSFHEEVDGRSSSATFHLHCLQERLESKPKELMRRKKNMWSKMAMFPNATSSHWFKKTPYKPWKSLLRNAKCPSSSSRALSCVLLTVTLDPVSLSGSPHILAFTWKE